MFCLVLLLFVFSGCGGEIDELVDYDDDYGYGDYGDYDDYDDYGGYGGYGGGGDGFNGGYVIEFGSDEKYYVEIVVDEDVKMVKIFIFDVLMEVVVFLVENFELSFLVGEDLIVYMFVS